ITVSNATTGVASSCQWTYNADGTPATFTQDNDSATTYTFSYTSYPDKKLGQRIQMANASSAHGNTQIAYAQPPLSGSSYTERVTSANHKNGITKYDFDANGDVRRIESPSFAGASQPPVYTFTYD